MIIPATMTKVPKARLAVRDSWSNTTPMATAMAQRSAAQMALTRNARGFQCDPDQRVGSAPKRRQCAQQGVLDEIRGACIRGHDRAGHRSALPIVHDATVPGRLRALVHTVVS